MDSVETNIKEDTCNMNLIEMNKKLSKIIARNIRALLKINSMSQNLLCDKLKEYNLEINQSTLSKYLPKEADQQIIPISLVVLICKIFNVSIEKITTENSFSVNDSLNATSCQQIHKAIEDLYPNSGFSDYLATGIARASNKFIVNGADEAFSGYYQHYFCYLYPTISSEKHLLTADLEFKEENEHCKAILKLNTGRHDKNNEPIYKYYNGIMVIVEKTKSCYCILVREMIKSTNELCFLNFRYIPIGDSNRNLDCRMVEVLTTSAGGDSSFPTVHRMFISRDRIRDEDLKIILPHLYLNNSTITIDENELLKVAGLSKEYKEIIKSIVALIVPEKEKKEEIYKKLDMESEIKDFEDEKEGTSTRKVMYKLREDLVVNTANLKMSKRNVSIFISQLRGFSYAFRFNKVSKKLDDNVRKALLSLGYYAYGEKRKKKS